MTSTYRRLRTRVVVTAFSALACAGQTPNAAREPVAAPVPNPRPAPAAPKKAPATPDWLSVDPANKTATLSLVVTSRPNSPSALINGYRNGQARIVVPLGWTAKWNWKNADTASHSLVLMVQREKLPLEGGRPAFSNAMTRTVTEGLPPGGTDQTTFTAEEAGWYWLMCGVPGHALAGEWLELRVDPDVRTGEVRVKE